MIRKSLEPETEVWHQFFGIGTFKGFRRDQPEYARVKYDNHPHIRLIPRTELTEIEEEE